MSFIDTAIGTGRKIYTFIKPHTPTIAVVGGSVAVCGGAFFACKATLHADEVLEEHNAMMERIAETAALAETEPKIDYGPKEIRHDKLQVYASTAGKFLKLYAPAIGLSATGFAAIFAGFGMIKRWHALAVSSVAALDEKFADYRNSVVNEYGAEVDKRFFEGVRETKQIEKKTIDEETGVEKVETVDAVNLNGIEDDFTWIFDYHSPKWDESGYLYNDTLIVNLQDWYTKQLQSHRMDHVFMNMVGKEFGKPETGIGHFYGWTDKPGCHVFFSAQPFVRMWDEDEDGQFPMMVPLPVFHNENGRFQFINEEDEELWRKTYTENDHNVGYILKFNVDTDENGVPRQIYNDVYGPQKAA